MCAEAEAQTSTDVIESDVTRRRKSLRSAVDREVYVKPPKGTRHVGGNDSSSPTYAQVRAEMEGHVVTRELGTF